MLVPKLSSLSPLFLRDSEDQTKFLLNSARDDSQPFIGLAFKLEVSLILLLPTGHGESPSGATKTYLEQTLKSDYIELQLKFNFLLNKKWLQL